MSKFDLMNDIDLKVAVAPTVISDGSSITSAVIDTKGYQSLTLVVVLGSVASATATWSVDVLDGDTATQADHTSVDDDFIIGTKDLAGFGFDDDSLCKKIGYKGSSRYVSLEITNVVANADDLEISVVAILGHPHSRPTNNPPAA